MDKAKIDKALVFASRVGDCPNDYLLKEIAPHQDRLYGVAAVHPCLLYTKMSEIKNESKRISDWYSEGKFVACKFYTGYEHYFPGDKVIEEYLMNFEYVGCPAIFHSGDCLAGETKAKLKYAHPLHIDEVAVDFPNMNFIIAHMGFPWVKDAAQVCYKNPNVYADISGFVYGEFQTSDRDKFAKIMHDFVEICSKEKLMFGTDWPISNQESYIEAVNSVFYGQEKIMFKTAEKVFKL